jgi:5-methylcytosine-specific restriction enzyme subunit McrC
MHSVDLQEWQDTFLPNVLLTANDQRLAASLNGVELREMRDGLYIKASSWVGIVSFGSFTLRIRPKLANLDVMRMVLMTGGLERLRRYQATRSYALQDAETSLFDLVALLFADSCTMLVKEGLLQGYVVEEDDLPVMRGRLRVAEQVRRRYGQINRLECHFDDHHANVIENRILHTALALCRRHVQHPAVRSRIQALLDVFAAATTPFDGDWRFVRAEMTYDRLNTRYREAHQLAWMVLEGLQVHDLLMSGATRGFAFLLDMNRLFEKFIEVLVRAMVRHMPIDVQSQWVSTGHIWDAERKQTYQRLRPDLLLTTQTGLQLAIDAKYKRYDTRKLQEGDIYQTFLYTYAFRDTAGKKIPSALLIYPADVPTQTRTRLHIRDSAGAVQAQLHAFGVDIAAMLDALFVPGRQYGDDPFGDLRREIENLLTSN